MNTPSVPTNTYTFKIKLLVLRFIAEGGNCGSLVERQRNESLLL